ncbi:hypothetical protein B0H21DRAFT_525818 [Amylocystis lapponica]|nr:hypothetical protein B0H21DRAFT_525818 [Amylocystis lapponica]
MRSPRCCWTRRSAMRAVFALGGSALHAAHVVRALYSVSVVNDCGYGVPVLDRIPSDTIATGTGVVFQNTTILDAFAFLNTGNCGPNGGNCTAVEVNLGNPDGSSNAMVDLVPTHVYSVAVSFSFYNACTGAGTSCLTESCVNAARDDSEINGLVSCPAANDPDHSAGLLVTWCPDIPQNYSSRRVQPAVPRRRDLRNLCTPILLHVACIPRVPPRQSRAHRGRRRGRRSRPRAPGPHLCPPRAAQKYGHDGRDVRDAVRRTLQLGRLHA